MKQPFTKALACTVSLSMMLVARPPKAYAAPTISLEPPNHSMELIESVRTGFEFSATLSEYVGYPVTVNIAFRDMSSFGINMATPEVDFGPLDPPIIMPDNTPVYQFVGAGITSFYFRWNANEDGLDEGKEYIQPYIHSAYYENNGSQVNIPIVSGMLTFSVSDPRYDAQTPPSIFMSNPRSSGFWNDMDNDGLIEWPGASQLRGQVEGETHDENTYIHRVELYILSGRVFPIEGSNLGSPFQTFYPDANGHWGTLIGFPSDSGSIYKLPAWVQEPTEEERYNGQALTFVARTFTDSSSPVGEVISKDTYAHIELFPWMISDVNSILRGPTATPSVGTPGDGITQARIWWLTSHFADSYVEYGLSPTTLTQNTGVFNNCPGHRYTTHETTLNNLTPNTPYYYRVKSSSCFENIPFNTGAKDAISAVLSFTTPNDTGGSDTTKPSVSITNPLNNQYRKGNVVFEISASDNKTPTQNLVVKVGAAGLSENTATYDSSSGKFRYTWNTTSPLLNGSYNFYATAKDEAGNTETSATVTLNIDNTNPSIVIDEPANGAYVPKNNYRISGRTTPNDTMGLSSVELWVNGVMEVAFNTNLSAWSYDFDFKGVTNPYPSIVARVRDRAGNTADHSISVAIDGLTPQITLVSPINNSTVNSPVNMSFDIIDPLLTASVGSGIKTVELRDASLNLVTTNRILGTDRWQTGNLNLSSGLKSYSIKAFDNVNNSSLINFSFTVNGAPIANNDSASVAEGGTIANLNVLSNDSDPEGSVLSAPVIVVGQGPAHGAVTVNADKTIKYVHNGSETTTDSFKYTTSDGSLSSNQATVSITITSVNDAPSANAQNVSTNEDTPKAITLTGSDPEGTALTYIIVTQPTKGTLSGTAPNVTYTPNANYAGPDSFTFKVREAVGATPLESAPATISITVSESGNDAPTANPQNVSTNEDTPKAITLTGSDPEGTALTYLIVTQPTKGVLSGTAPNVTYTPNANYAGADSFTFKVREAVGATPLESAPATVSITVSESGNDAPIANNDSASVAEGGTIANLNVLSNDSDPEGSVLSAPVIVVGQGPAHGAVTVNADKTIKYVHNGSETTTDSFKYTTSDGSLSSNQATVSITITSVNDAPSANAQNVSTNEDTPKAITLTGSDPEGTALTYIIVTPPTKGTLSGTAPNVTYTPNANYAGPDSFTFKVREAVGATPLESAPATISITVVESNNDAPTANPQNVSTNEDTPKAITLTGSDPEGTALTYLIVTQPTKGVLSGTAPNVTYTPNANYAGADSFTFKVREAVGATPLESAPATVSITVSESGNDAPIANNDSASVAEGGTIANLNVLSNDSDPEGSVLSAPVIVVGQGPAHGAVTVNADKTIKYVHNGSETTTDSFKYTTSDGSLSSNQATVSITITSVNDAPSANAQNVSTNEDTPKAITLTGSDPEGTALTYLIVTQPTKGTLSGTAPNVTYTPNANYAGPDSFTFKVREAVGATPLESAPATVSITVVESNNDAPTANPQNVSTNEDTPKAITLTGTDPEGTALTYLIVTQPTKGVLSGTAPNVTYTPNTNYAGPDSFTFKVREAVGATPLESAPATVSITVSESGNDAPIANNDSASVAEGGTIANLNVLSNDSDPEGSVLSAPVIVVGQGPAHGAVTVNADKTIKYVHNGSETTTDSFKYTTSDGSLSSNQATVSITITSVNDAPSANAQNVSTNEDTPKAITLTGSDPEGTALTYIIVTPPTKGTLSGTAPNVTYTPNANYAGPDSFTFKVREAVGATPLESAPATISITVVESNNDAPTANPQNVSTNEDTPKAITLTGSDPEGTALTYLIVTQPTKGVLSGTAPNVTYTPNANYAGADSFTFKVREAVGATPLESAPATVSITVSESGNDAPIANNDSASVAEGGTIANLNVLSNDSDPEGSVLSAPVIVVGQGPAHGAVTVNADKTIKYVHNGSETTTDSFKYTTSDGSLSSNQATVSITITSVNDAPSANAQNVSTNEDTPKAITLTGSDPEGTALTYIIVTPPTKGTLSGTAPNVTYTPNANYAGPDSFTFKVREAVGATPLESAPATVSITVVESNNDAPTANPQNVSTNEDTPKAITLTGTDPEGTALTYLIVTQPTKGVLSGTAPNVTYTPNTNYAGPDSFTFKVREAVGATPLESAPATVSITVSESGNDAPIANNDSASVAEGGTIANLNVLSNDSDPEGSVLSAPVIVVGQGPAHGAVTVNADKTIKYVHNGSETTTDSFKYTTSDGSLSSNQATVSITITSVNDAPSANAQNVSTNEDTPKAITLTGSDPEGTALTYLIVTQPTKGTLSGTAPNVTYTPNANYTGPDSFTFKVREAVGATPLESAPATVSITVVESNNDAPTANPQNVSTNEDTPKAITLTGTDPEGTALTYLIVTQPTKGVLSGTAPNVTYTPNTNYAGPDSFTFKVREAVGATPLESAPATVSITVSESGNDAPIANNDSASVAEGGTIANLNVLSNDSDPEGSVLSAPVIVVGQGPAHGAVTVNADKTIKYVHNGSETTTDSFKYTTSDGSLSSNQATVSITITSVNDAPSANAQNVSTNEDTPKAITLTGSDPEGTALTYIIVTPPTKGTLSGTAPNVTYTPNANYAGPDSFTFKVREAVGATPLESAPATISITVVESNNDAPTANPQNVSTNEDTPKAITLTGSDPEGTALTYLIVTQPTKGVLSGTAPNVTYTPNANYAGADSFTFKVREAVGATPLESAPATVSITVSESGNDAPIANNDSASVAEGGTIANLNVLSNDSDPEGSVLSAPVIVVGQGPAHGAVTVNADKTIKYVHNGSETTTDSFKYTTSDGSLSSNQATVSITITSVNDAPSANAQNVSTNEDTPKAITLTGSDPEGTALTYLIVTQPTKGTLSGTAPNVTYTPNANYAGPDSFTFKVREAVGATPLESAPATVSITVVESNNDAPTANPQNVSTNEDTPKAITLTGTDPEGTALTYLIVTQPTKGVLSGTAPNVTYTPNTNYAGPDSFTFKVREAVGATPLESAPATVSITVSESGNDAPIANNDSASVAEGGTIANLNVLSNDSDPEGSVLSAPVIVVGQGPAHGAVTVNADKTIKYVHNGSETTTDSFKYTTSDGSLSSNQATVSITITSVNDAPSANAQNVSTNEDTPKAITLTGSDPEGTALTYLIVTQPTKGTLSGTAPNVTYTPNANYTGPDSFTFKVREAVGATPLESAPATVSITVSESGNDAPIANNDSASVAEGGTIANLNVLSNDSDPEGSVLSAPVIVVGQGPAHGAVTVNADKTIKYVHNGSETTTDSFKYTTSDGSLSSNQATVSITITSVNDAPSANAQNVSTNEDTPKAITLTGSDPEGTALTYIIVTPPTKGTLSGTAPNVTYTPNANYAGPDSFTFKVREAVGATPLESAPATISITVVESNNDAPTANPQNVSTNEDTPKAITLTGSDPEGTALTYLIVTQPTKGVLSGTAPNVTYTPNANYAGADSFTFKVREAVGATPLESAPATVSITVSESGNDAPIANNDSASVAEGGTIANLNVLSNDSDPEGSVLSAPVIVVGQGPAHGAVTVNADKTIKYVHNGSETTTDSFKYTTSDGSLSSNQATVSITITSVNDAPSANAQNVSTNEDTPKAITLTGSDPEGTALTYLIVTQPTKGTLSGTAPNVTYTPNANYAGPDSFTFKVREAVGATPLESAPATVSITVVESNNDAPTANPQNVSTNEDTPKAITLTGTDPEGTALTYLIVTQPTKGVLSGTAPNVTYTPNTNYAGPDSFTFKVREAVGATPLESAPATVSITVSESGNDAPIANNDSASVAEGGTIANLNVLSNDSDPEGSVLSAPVIVVGQGPAHGAVTVNADKTIKYVHNGSETTTDSFKYTTSDGSLSSNQATVSITITSVNDAPSANAQNVSTNEDTPKAITLTGSDPEGTALTYLIVTQPTKGTLSGTAPNVTYTPNANYTGPDSFTFKVREAVGATPLESAPATVSITVSESGNDAPIANNDSASVAEGGTIANLNVLSNDSDPEGSVLSAPVIVVGQGPAHGAVTVNADKTIKYVHNGSETTTDSFKYTTSDGSLSSNQATVSITITSVNDAPSANAQNVSTNEDTPKAITLTGSDPEGTALTYLIVTQPTKGTLSGTAPNVTYTPNANYAGPDSFTFKVREAVGATPLESAPATVSISVVESGNDAPTANAQSVTTNEDTPKAITLTGSDPEGTALTYIIVTQPTQGVLSGTAPNVTYTPNANYAGPDSFTFKVREAVGATPLESAPATVSITVSESGNDAPIANNDSASVAEGGTIANLNVLSNDSDPEGSVLSAPVIVVGQGPAHGAVTVNADKTIKYVHNGSETTTDSFKYTTSDGSLSSNQATVSITITSVNDAPSANAQNVSTNEDTPKAITLTGSDPEGTALTYLIVTQPTKGTLSGTAPNVTYTPNANYTGPDSFTFKVNDGAQDSTAAAVSITVIESNNDAPTANPQSVSTNEDTAKVITLTGSDPEGTALTYIIVTPPTRGSLSVVSGANVTYTPNSNYVGPDSFTFKVREAVGATPLESAPATVSISVVESGNDAPTANAQSVTTNEDTPKAITLTGTDPEGTALTYLIVTQPTKGVLSGTAPNVTYTPNTNYAGPDSFTFKVNDGAQDSTAAAVSITVIESNNDAPTANPQNVSTNEDTAKVITLTGSDPEGTALTYIIVTPPTRGSLSVVSGANVTYTPNTNYVGPDSFTFKVREAVGATPLESAPATVSISVVESGNDAPTANAQSVTTNEDTPKAITLTGTDPEGTALTYLIVTQPTKGTLSGTAPNVTYTPNANYAGPDSFTFKVNDGAQDSTAAAVSITVIESNNDAPIANAQSVSTNEDTAKVITMTGTDPEGTALTYIIVTPPTKGTLSVISGANVTYTPNPNYAGYDLFTFKVREAVGTAPLESTPANVSIAIIESGNDAPIANAQSVSTNEDTPKAMTLTGSDPEGSALTFAIVTPPTKGTLSGTAPNITYTPNTNYAGADSFTFKVNDGAQDSTAAAVSITIIESNNDAPTANAQSVSTNEDTAKVITLTGSDPEGTALTYIIVTPPTKGTLSVISGANVTYTPNSNYYGTDLFTFKVRDIGGLESSAATVSITVIEDLGSHDPEINITYPANGATLNGEFIFIRGNASDPDNDLARIELYLGSDTTPFETLIANLASWSSSERSFVNGTHTIKAKAIDAVGHFKETSITFTADNSLPPEDNPNAPTVKITYPADGSRINGAFIFVKGTAQDPNNDLDKVELYLNGATTPFETLTNNLASWTASEKSFPDGTHTLRAKVFDQGGRYNFDSITFIADSSRPPEDNPNDPSVTITFPSDGSTINGLNIRVIGIASDPNNDLMKIDLFLDGSSTPFETLTANLASWQSAVRSFANGPHTIKARATDLVGHYKEHSITFTVDNSLPTSNDPVINITYPLNGSTINGEFIFIRGNAADPNNDLARIELYLGSDTTPFETLIANLASWSSSERSFVNGTHTIKAKAIDAVGHFKETSITFTADNSLPPEDNPNAPTVKITYPADGSRINGAFIFVKGTAQDPNNDLDKVELYLNGATTPFETLTNNLASWTASEKSFPDGTHTLRAKVFDQGGRYNFDSITFIADSSRPPEDNPNDPSVTITFPSDGSTINGLNIRVIGIASDPNNDLMKIDLFLDGSSTPFETLTANLASWQSAVRSFANGPHTIKARATDLVGHYKEHSITFTVDNSLPTTDDPLVKITYPLNGSSLNGFKINIAGTASDPNNDLARIELYLGSDTTPFETLVTNLASWSSIERSFVDGTYTIKARAIDVVGHMKEDSVTFTIDNSLPTPHDPVINITYPLNGSTINGEFIFVKGNASDPDNDLEQILLFLDSEKIPFEVITANLALWSSSERSFANGTHTIRAKAIDAVGHFKETSITFTADNSLPPEDNPNAPTVKITYPVDGSRINGAFIFVKGTAQDPNNDLDKVELYLNGATTPFETLTNNLASWTASEKSFPDGTHTLRAKVFDQVGRYNFDSITFIADSSGPRDPNPHDPSITITYPMDGSTIATSKIIISGTSADPDNDLARIELRLDGIPEPIEVITNNLGSWSSNELVLSEGPHTIHARVIDVIGHEKFALTTFTIDTPDVFIPEPGTLQFRPLASTQVKEGELMELVVERINGTSGDVSIDVLVQDGQAILGTDFTISPMRLIFGDGETEKVVKINAIDDSLFEDNELVTLSLENPAGNPTIGNPSQLTVTIINKGLLPTEAPTTLPQFQNLINFNRQDKLDINFILDLTGIHLEGTTSDTGTSRHHVKLEIFNMKGELIQTLFDGEMTSGAKVVTWYGKNSYHTSAAPDVYLLLMYSDGQLRQRQKIMIVR